MDTLRWEDGKLKIIDQTRLPMEEIILEIETIEECREAIKTLRVRGAPAIGDAAAFGMVLGLKKIKSVDFEDFYKAFQENKRYLASSRPTAVNLFWALDRMDKVVLGNADRPIETIHELLEKEAKIILAEDEKTCRMIGEYGAELLKDGMNILTHCNAGRLATARYGTALAPVYVAKEQNKKIHVYADETRPMLQGSRLTAYELKEAGIEVTVITDSMAAYVMQNRKIDMVIVGCDRVAANGDTANKIGTYALALVAKAHKVPFYVAGPLSSIDRKIKTGGEIRIEERAKEEVTCGFGRRTAPEGVDVLNPAFDVTDHTLITGFITEKGLLSPPFREAFIRAFETMEGEAIP